MINVLSYIGMNLQSEACLWTLLGLVRTIFDATLFRVNANLKQVWQMSMPAELSMPVQRVLRTMISGVILVQCFTVYIYLASYIVLLYPVFLEERPTLVLPWLLLAAIRQLLCELTSLALGLGTCVLLGPARPPCIKFVIIKVISIMPSFYMWMLLFSYYHSLKIAAVFKKFPAVLPSSGDQDYGLELAIRRRRTKSLLGEEQLRSKIVASLYGDRNTVNEEDTRLSKIGISSRMMHSTDTSAIDLIKEDTDKLQPKSSSINRISETGAYEDWFGSEVVLPRGRDRILEQFVLMLLRIKVYLDKKGEQPLNTTICNSKSSRPTTSNYDDMHCTSIPTDNTDTPFQVGSKLQSSTASYLQEYPHIFMKKTSDMPRSNNTGESTSYTLQENEENINTTRSRKRSVTVSSKEKIPVEIEKVVSQRKYVSEDKNHLEHKLSPDAFKEAGPSSKETNFKDTDCGTIRIFDQNVIEAVQQEDNESSSSDKENRADNRSEMSIKQIQSLKNERLGKIHESDKSSTSSKAEIIKEPSSGDDKSVDLNGNKNMETKNET